ncbi:MAG: DNA helicase [Hyphomonadaceae bacterium]
MLAEAHKTGRFCGYFSLEYSNAEAGEILTSYGLKDSDVLLDTSDAICADYMIAKLTAAKPGGVIVVDYLQALDHQREKPPLADQVAALKAFAAQAGLIFVFISQIDRHYDADAKAFPDIADVRMPNRIDTAMFNKTCFLREGEIALHDAGLAAT